MTLKLTPTTNDLKRIDPAHEPLKNGDGHDLPSFSGNPTPIFSYTGDFNVTPIPAPEPAPATVVAAKPRKVAIVGTAPSSRGLAPFGDPSWEIWACSAGNMGAIPRVDVWFEVHSNLLWPENVGFGKPYLDWLNQQTFPIYMQDNTLVPRAIPFPKTEMIQEFGRYFFTSSFAWMAALAIKQGVQEIGLWGVDMASRDEYILQRSGGHFFLNEAMRRGIKVTLPPESDLLQPPPLYGFDDSTRFMRKVCVREKELRDRIAPMRNQRDQLNSQIVYLEGALEDIDYIKSIWGGAQSSQD